MLSLLRVLWDIALWRRTPGDLPVSRALAAVSAIAYLLVSWLQALQVYGQRFAGARAVADLALTLAAFWLLLAIAGRGPRFLQAISAVLGVGAMLSVPMLAVVALRGPATGHYLFALGVWVGTLTLTVWYLFALGHIVRSALESSLLAAMAVTVIITFGSTALLTRLFPAGS
jgi:hypothetical protein